MFGRKRQAEQGGAAPAKTGAVKTKDDGPLRIDGAGIKHVREAGAVDEITWDELREVRIVTTSGGPFSTDVLWHLLGGEDAEPVVLPGPLVVDDVLARLQRLPDFDNIALIKAMGSSDDAEFTVWQRAS